MNVGISGVKPNRGTYSRPQYPPPDVQASAQLGEFAEGVDSSSELVTPNIPECRVVRKSLF